MRPTPFTFITAILRVIFDHARNLIRTLAFATTFLPAFTSIAFSADPYVEFDLAPMAEGRDVTPPERIAQYPHQRLIEVSVPVSVRFRGLSMDEVDELAIEIYGASPGMRVEDFYPATQLASDVTDKIETTTTSKKTRSFDGSLGGTFPIPGAEAVAHVTPSVSAGLADCDTETEKMNRLPPKRAVVVSGTTSAGRGVFFKLKRYSQASLEGVHDLKVTFVVPRAWRYAELRVNCDARGEQKTFWRKQTGIVGHAARTLQLVEATPKPSRQMVLKPTEPEKPATKPKPPEDKPVIPTDGQWRASLQKVITAEVTKQLAPKPKSKSEKLLADDQPVVTDEQE
jgi:hypothetical protein